MIEIKDLSARALPPIPVSKDAIFMGWQKMKSGEVLALYNVIAVGHASFGSTLTDKGLRRLDLQIPWTPHPEGLVKEF